MKILVIQNKRIGDVLLASIIANNLKNIYPDCEVSFFCYDYAAPILKNNHNIDRVIEVNEKELKKSHILLKYALFIRKEKFDLIIDPYVKLQSQLINLISGAKRRISYEKKTLPFAYTHQIPLLKHKNSEFGKAIDDRVNLITAINEKIKVDAFPKIFLDAEEIIQGKKKLSDIDPSRKTLIFGVLGSSISKSLPIEYTVEIIEFLSAHYNFNILFNYMPNQLETVNKILSQVKNTDKIYPHIVGKDIREFIKIMYHCDLLIANEGGSVHIAKALNKPTFTVFSPFIIKDFWATFENDPKNKSIHLKEVRPDLYYNKSRKEIDAKSKELYQEFLPELIIPKLKDFLSENGY